MATQGEIKKEVGGGFFDKLPGKDEVVFERGRTSAHSARMERVAKAFPEGYAFTTIDNNTPGTLQQQAMMENQGWQVVPRSEIQKVGLSEVIPSSLLLMACKEEVRDEHLRMDAKRAATNAINAMEFETGNQDVHSSVEVSQGDPVTISGPVRG